jgi:hypothetical protein
MVPTTAAKMKKRMAPAIAAIGPAVSPLCLCLSLMWIIQRNIYLTDGQTYPANADAEGEFRSTSKVVIELSRMAHPPTFVMVTVCG